MKVIILAGGWGSRLGQQSEEIPKPMVHIGDRPILWHIMKIYSHFGYNDFILSLGVKAHVIKSYFKQFNLHNENFTVDLEKQEIIYHNQNNIKWKVTLVDTGLNTLKGARIKRVENFLDDDINLLTYGDGVADINLDNLVEFHNSHGKTLTITGVRPPSLFGEIIEDKGKVISFEEKPQTSVGLINGGFMVFNRNLLDHLSEDEDCDFEFGPLEKLAKQGEVMVYKHEGSWECMDTERDVVHLNKLWQNERAFWKVWS